MDEVRIRAAAKGDVVVLAKLMTELGYPTSTEAMSRRLEEISADPSYRALVAERDGQVLGMVGLHVERKIQVSGPRHTDGEILARDDGVNHEQAPIGGLEEDCRGRIPLVNLP